MLNAELHGIRAGAWPTGEEKERGAKKKNEKPLERSHATIRMQGKTSMENDQMVD